MSLGLNLKTQILLDQVTRVRNAKAKAVSLQNQYVRSFPLGFNRVLSGSADQSACRGANCYITLTGRGEIEADRGGRGRKGTSSEETHLDSLPRFPVCPRGKTVRQPAGMECEARCCQRTDWRGGIPDGEGVMAAFGCRGLESFGGQWGGREREKERESERRSGSDEGEGNRQPPGTGTHAWHDLPSPTHARVRSS